MRLHARGHERRLWHPRRRDGAGVGRGLQASGTGNRGGSGALTVKVDKTLVASVALHVLVIGWGLVSFSSKAFESTEIETVPVEFVTDDQLSKITAGIKSGKKENPKPLVEKVAEAKPMDDAVGKITEKTAVVTDAAPDPVPKPAEKPVEKKPDPPKVDPIAEALKKEEVKKPAPKR